MPANRRRCIFKELLIAVLLPSCLKRIPPTARQHELFTAEQNVGAFSPGTLMGQGAQPLLGARWACPAGLALRRALGSLAVPCSASPIGRHRLCALQTCCPACNLPPPLSRHTGNAHSIGVHALSIRSPEALWSRALTVPENSNREETSTLCLCTALHCPTQQCDNLLSPSFGNTSPVIAELRLAAPRALLALQQILINVCYPFNYLFFPDMLLTFFPSIQQGPELFGSMCVFTAFTKGIVKKLKLYKTSGPSHTSIILLQLVKRPKEGWSPVLLPENQ